MKIFDRFLLNPKKLFLIDGLGALLTAFLTGVVLRMFVNTFGMPPKLLSILSILACILAAYSMSCCFFVSKNWRLFLKIIVVANLLYCFLTAVLVLHLYQQLTTLGVIYFITEVFIIIVLVYVEVSVAFKNITD